MSGKKNNSENSSESSNSQQNSDNNNQDKPQSYGTVTVEKGAKQSDKKSK